MVTVENPVGANLAKTTAQELDTALEQLSAVTMSTEDRQLTPEARNALVEVIERLLDSRLKPGASFLKTSAAEVVAQFTEVRRVNSVTHRDLSSICATAR